MGWEQKPTTNMLIHRMLSGSWVVLGITFTFVRYNPILRLDWRNIFLCMLFDVSKPTDNTTIRRRKSIGKVLARFSQCHWCKFITHRNASSSFLSKWCILILSQKLFLFASSSSHFLPSLISYEHVGKFAGEWMQIICTSSVLAVAPCSQRDQKKFASFMRVYRVAKFFKVQFRGKLYAFTSCVFINMPGAPLKF